MTAHPRVAAMPPDECRWCARLHTPGPEHCLWGWAVVCGGRTYDDRATLFAALDRLAGRMELSGIRHGAATGADTLAGEWARLRGVPEDPCPADWSQGRKAGPQRNAEMLAKAPRPVCVVALPGGKGTASMVALAAEAGLYVWRVRGAP